MAWLPVIFIIMALAYLLVYVIAIAIVLLPSFLIYKGIIWALRSLKGEVKLADHFVAACCGFLPLNYLLIHDRYLPGWTFWLTVIPIFASLIYHLEPLMTQRTEASEASIGNDDPHEANTKEEVTISTDDSKPTKQEGNPLADLYAELGEILKRDDRNLLLQRLAGLKRSMDATTYEKNIAAWLRKFKAAAQIMEAMNKADRLKMDHDFMSLEKQKKEAEFKADIEHHKAREAEAKMRQRMAKEE